MNFTKVKDQELISHTIQIAKKERELLVEVLDCLREIERRRLFSSLGYSSLFDFCVYKLSYSEAQAVRRIQAMRFIRTVPEVEPMIENGALTLTTVGLAHSHIKREEEHRGSPYTPTEKLGVIQVVSGKAAREAEAALLEIAQCKNPIRPDTSKLVSKELIELRITVTKKTWEHAEKLKGLLAHEHPNLSLGELFGITCQLAVDKWSTYPPSAPKVKNTKSPLHRAIWNRDQGRCRNCGSQHALEVDHIQPKALGGADTPENLCLLCRNCNQRKAIEAFGLKKMEKFLQR